jgi:hypothetical protein
MRARRFESSVMSYNLRIYYRVHAVHPAEIAEASWYKSSVSSYNGNCVEVSHLRDGRVAVRDTKERTSGPTLIFTRPEWEAFLEGAKDGEFDSI